LATAPRSLAEENTSILPPGLYPRRYERQLACSSPKNGTRRTSRAG